MKQEKETKQDDFKPLQEKYFLRDHLTGTREDAKFWATVPSHYGKGKK